MSRSLHAVNEKDLERALLRKSVGRLAGGRDHCADCGRTPLIGETIYHYSTGAAVCELCRPLRRAEPDRSERVQHDEYGQTVRVHRLGAA